jgi:molybdopterin adenylyltransferase
VKFSVAIITVSDKGSTGEREDRSGPRLKEMLDDAYDVRHMVIIPDEQELIAATIKGLIDDTGIDLVLTTGGTGVTKRDVTPEAVRLVIEKELPGFSEVMRMESYKITPHGIISRGICGIRKESIIVSLPGSPKAAAECLGFVIQALSHALSKVKDDPTDCA